MKTELKLKLKNYRYKSLKLKWQPKDIFAFDKQNEMKSFRSFFCLNNLNKKQNLTWSRCQWSKSSFLLLYSSFRTDLDILSVCNWKGCKLDRTKIEEVSHQCSWLTLQFCCFCMRRKSHLRRPDLGKARTPLQKSPMPSLLISGAIHKARGAS